MSINALTAWLNPLLMLAGLVTLFMLQTTNNSATAAAQAMEAPLVIASHR